MGDGSSFVPTEPVELGDEDDVANDPFYPLLKVSAFVDETGLDDAFPPAQLRTFLDIARIEVNGLLTDWRLEQTMAALSIAPESSRLTGDDRTRLYTGAVHARARASLIDTRRDYDTTAKGHDRADALEMTSDTWRQLAHENLSRLMGRGRATIELI